MAHALTAYVSASTNRYNQAADSSSSSLIAFGSGRLVCLWDVAVRLGYCRCRIPLLKHLKDQRDPGVSETLPGHQGLVTCVRFVRDDMFASADDKGGLRCWRKIGHQACPQSADHRNVPNKRCGYFRSGELQRLFRGMEKLSLLYVSTSNIWLVDHQMAR
jgi:hypothetical protein